MYQNNTDTDALVSFISKGRQCLDGKLRQDITHLTCKSLLLYTAHNCPLHTSRGITFLWSNLPFPPFFTFSFDISKRRLT